MCQYLRAENIVGIEATERNENNIIKSLLDSKVDHKHEYFLESGLKYPQIIHETEHFPFFPEKKNKGKNFSQLKKEKTDKTLT